MGKDTMKAFVGTIVGSAVAIVITVILTAFWQSVTIARNIRQSKEYIEHCKQERGITK